LQQTWQFSEADQIAEIMVAGRLKINNIYALVNATIAGHGIAYLPKLLVMEHIKKGHLVEINLRGAKPIAPYIYAIYPTRHFLPVKVRLFIDALTAWLSPIAPWDRED
jgi:DNA-binding transcriptional LysR family regulator